MPAVTHGSAARGARRRRTEDGEQGEDAEAHPEGACKAGRGGVAGGRRIGRRRAPVAAEERRRRRRLEARRLDSVGREEEGSEAEHLGASVEFGEASCGEARRRPWWCLGRACRRGREQGGARKRSKGRERASQGRPYPLVQRVGSSAHRCTESGDGQLATEVLAERRKKTMVILQKSP
jgi:hypothetical protein